LNFCRERTHILNQGYPGKKRNPYPGKKLNPPTQAKERNTQGKKKTAVQAKNLERKKVETDRRGDPKTKRTPLRKKKPQKKPQKKKNGVSSGDDEIPSGVERSRYP
jgi:hypothetical protein